MNMISVPSLMLFLFLYMMSFYMVLSGDDWFLVWLGLEINMLSFIVLVYYRYSINIMESCFKYFFIQSMGSVIFVGSLFLSSIFLMEVLIFVLSYKIGAGPFYFWFPPMCMGLSWSSCYVLMTFQKIIPLMLMSLFLNWVMWLIVIFSLVFGAMGSFNQSDIKQLLAYSSVHHLGWLLLCQMSNDIFWMMYLLIYSMVLLSIIYTIMDYEIISLTMVSKWKCKWWFVMSMLSMGGIPPLLGFYLKWMAFICILKMDFMCMVLLVMMSVIMFYVYIRVLYDVLMDNGMDISWSNFVFMKKFMIKMDYFSIFGMLLGVMFGVILMIFYIKMLFY